jgi:hypothetical protein
MAPYLGLPLVENSETKLAKKGLKHPFMVVYMMFEG